MKRLNPAVSVYLERNEIKYIHLFCIEKPNALSTGNSVDDWIYFTDGAKPYMWADREEIILGNNPTRAYSTFTADKIVEFTNIKETATPKSATIDISMYGELGGSYEYIIPHPNQTIGIGTYFGKRVRIYRAFLDDNDQIVGDPEQFRMAGTSGAVELLPGDISGPTLIYTGKIVSYEIEESLSSPKIIWRVNNFWESFNKVTARLTSDAEHRGLDEDGNPSPGGLLRPEYANDLGFIHSDRAVKLEATYQRKETRTRLKKSGGGFLSSPKYKLVEYTVWVTEKVNLDINTFARNLPVIYGTRYIDEPIIIFADTNLNDPEEIWVGLALAEGPIQALLDVSVDGKFLVCQDPEDAAERLEDGSIPCTGLASQGDVLGAVGLDGQHWPVTHGDYIQVGGEDLKIWFYAGLPYQHDLDRDVIYLSNDVRRGTKGQTASYDVKKLRSVLNISNYTNDADNFREPETPDDYKLRNIIQNENGTGLQFPTKASYFGDNHRLIDTCYVAMRVKLTEDGYTELPDVGFVLMGKYAKTLNRYNKDGVGGTYYPENIAPNEDPELDPSYWVSPDEFKLSSSWSIPTETGTNPLTPVIVQRFLADTFSEVGIPSLTDTQYYYSMDSIVSFNPVWQLLDYLTSTRYGAAIPIEFIDVDTVYTAAYTCYKMSKEYDSSFVKYWSRLTWPSGYTSVNDTGGIDKNRVDLNKSIHQCNTLIDTNTPVIENVKYLLDNFDGILTYSNGKYAIKVKSSLDNENLAIFPWNGQEVHVTQQDIIGDVRIAEDTTKRYNSVKASFIDPANQWKGRNISFFNSVYLEQDAKVSKAGRFDISAVTNYYSVRTKIKYFLRRSRDAKQYSFTLPHNYFFLEVGDVFSFTHEETGDVGTKLRIEELVPTNDLSVQLVCSIYKTDHYELSGSGDGPPVENPILDVSKPADPSIQSVSIVDSGNGYDIFNIVVNFEQRDELNNLLGPTEQIGILELSAEAQNAAGDPININFLRQYTVENATEVSGVFTMDININQLFPLIAGYEYTFFARVYNGKYSDTVTYSFPILDDGTVGKLPSIDKFYATNIANNSNVSINGYYTFYYNYIDTIWRLPPLLDLSGGKTYEYLFKIYVVDPVGNLIDTGETLTYPYTITNPATGVTNISSPYYTFEQLTFFKALVGTVISNNGLSNVPRSLTMSISIRRSDGVIPDLQSDETFLVGVKENS